MLDRVDIVEGFRFFVWIFVTFHRVNVKGLYDVCEQVQQETLFELILAANYMDIKPLLDLTCATVASMIKVIMFFIGGTGKTIMERTGLHHDDFLFDAGHYPCRVPSRVGRLSPSIPYRS